MPIRKNNSVSKLELDERIILPNGQGGKGEILEINLLVPEEKFIQNILTFI